MVEKLAINLVDQMLDSTLLNILGLLDEKYNGSYTLFGVKTNNLNLNQLAEWRNQRIGFVLQESALINSIIIEDNIKLPFLYVKSAEKYKVEDFESIINAIGIEPILKKKSLECSGGEKSRAVFARAIIMKPQLIL